MSPLSHHEILLLFISLAVLLGLARFLGEICRKLRQPVVVGEILAGVILGPTILGRFAPELQHHLFPIAEGGLAAVIEGISILAIVLFLLVAGMEVDLSVVWRQGTAALSVGAVGMIVPFGLGALVAATMPGLLGGAGETDSVVFVLFFATALSISALPVVAKILMDLGIYRSDLGMIMVAAAIFNDIVGWIIFAIILGMMGTVKVVAMPIWMVILLTLGFAILMLTVGRWAINRALPWLQAYASWPGGVLGFIAVGTFICAAFTEWIGVHAIFGAFLFGVALGDSKHLRAKTREALDQFISFLFVPLFFATIGLKVDFLANFHFVTVGVVCVVAFVGKVGGCWAGARLCKMPNKESLAIGCGLNARGAMEIILGLLALQAGVIGQELFVALVVMAILTSMLSGPLMEKVLKRQKPMTIAANLSSKQFVSALAAVGKRQVLDEMAAVLSGPAKMPAEEISQAVWLREQLIPTGLSHRVAVPHARIAGLAKPLIALGRSEHGIDFDARDGKPAQLLLMILTSKDDNGAQLQLLADLAHFINNEANVERVLNAAGFTEILAAFSETQGQGHG